jgi:hypothetical protein
LILDIYAVNGIGSYLSLAILTLLFWSNVARNPHFVSEHPWPNAKLVHRFSQSRISWAAHIRSSSQSRLLTSTQCRPTLNFSLYIFPNSLLCFFRQTGRRPGCLPVRVTIVVYAPSPVRLHTGSPVHAGPSAFCLGPYLAVRLVMEKAQAASKC